MEKLLYVLGVGNSETNSVHVAMESINMEFPVNKGRLCYRPFETEEVSTGLHSEHNIKCRLWLNLFLLNTRLIMSL
jgi:hypothetical protein